LVLCGHTRAYTYIEEGAADASIDALAGVHELPLDEGQCGVIWCKAHHALGDDIGGREPAPMMA
jgi:hypothetical protein